MNMASDDTTASAMMVVRLPLARIDRSKRLRPVDPIYALAIAESMRERGQLTPILVQAARTDGTYREIAGEHRCEALAINAAIADGTFQLIDGGPYYEPLTFTRDAFVHAIVHDVSDDEALMMEIDENLARADLSDLDRAIFLGRRKEVYERLHPQTRHGKLSKKDKVAESATILRFTLATARLTKQSERTIQQLVHRYEHIAKPVQARLRGTWIAKVGAQLDLIASLPPHEQMPVVDTMLRDVDAQPTVSAALVEVRGIQQKPKRTGEQERDALIALWRKTGTSGRQLFRQFLETPESRKAPETKAAPKSKKVGAL